MAQVVEYSFKAVLTHLPLIIILKTCPCKMLRFFGCKNAGKFFDIFFIFAQNIDCEYMLEPPWQDGSNEYPQSMFWIKNMCTPVYPSFAV